MPHCQQVFLKQLLIIIVILSGLTTTAQVSLAQSSTNCPDTYRELYETTPYLQGDDVLELQLRLLELGFNPGPCDGIYGPHTAATVRSFQRKNQLPLTGRVGFLTWSALGQGCERPPNTPPPIPPQGKVSILVDTEKRTLSLLVNDKIYRQFPVAVGKPNTPTPVGEWKIAYKGYNWGGGFGVRWLGLSVPWGIYGIHGTNKPWTIGTAASAGCIRMFNEDVLQVFDWVQIGTPVKIVGPPHWTTSIWRRLLTIGCFGPDVVYVQLSLKKLRLYPGLCDGWYGNLTALAVCYFQASAGLAVTGKVDEATYLLFQKKGGISVPSEPESSTFSNFLELIPTRNEFPFPNPELKSRSGRKEPAS